MLLALALLTTWKIPDPPAVYSGRAGQVEVRVPRLEADLSVDGKLAEAVWGESAVLTGFSQFSPTDGIPAADTTQVLVWYSATAIHFGVRAFEAHGPVHATLADRDKIAADDYIQILLSTFNDSRQALVFAVNPLGVQSDGALVETGSVSGNGFNNAVVKREQADLSPDYVFESKGRRYRVRIRDRGPDPLQEHPLPTQTGAELGASTLCGWCSTRGGRTAGRRPSGPAPRSWASRASW